LVQLIGQELGFTVDTVMSQNRITAGFLSGYDFVVWNNMSQNGQQSSTVKSVWQNYVEGGGGLVALHAAGDTRDNTWTWYMEGVLDARYLIHSAVEAADVWVHPDGIAPSGEFHPILKNQKSLFKEYTVTIAGKPTQKWANVWTDEWYVFPKDPNPNTADLTVLLELDEFNLRGVTNWDPNEQKTGYHPMAWARENIGAGKGRVAFLGTGHDGQIHQARARGLRELWKNAILWAAKNSTGCKNPAASNYNPWADKDDGNCQGVTSVRSRFGSSRALQVDGSANGFRLQLAGTHRVVLRDMSGRTLFSERLEGPCARNFGVFLSAGGYTLTVSNVADKTVAEYLIQRN
jgi:type 1 glutamine amidotransferase